MTQPEPLDPETVGPADWDDDADPDEPGWDDHDPYEWWPPGTDAAVVAAQLAEGWRHDDGWLGHDVPWPHPPGVDGWIDGRPYRTVAIAGGVL
jgi:hypothetical protein